MTAEPVAPEVLEAYVDGRLDREQAAAVEVLLAADPELRARVADHREQSRLIRAAADALEPATVDLRTAALERMLAQQLAQRQRRPLFRLAQVAAAAALFAAGWLGHAQLAPVLQPQATLPGYVAEATGAHRVFADDPARPVEFTELAGDAVLDWFSAKLGRAVAVPELGGFGLALVGARLHGTAEGPLVQFVYEDEAGERLSYVVARHPESAPLLEPALAEVSGERVAYWRDPQLDHVLVARAAAPPLADIAARINASLP